ncbi:MAG: molybdenum cofactor sulfurase [Deltaproteobacteria bacterium RIFOXYD12_FULL_56_24]|nr:MAG: molybdenum cofactor sulfurase [Deltaproteobacteria bacterium RIFOXYD12_FULL_56_24]
MSVVEAVCISEKKGMVKKEVPEINLEENWGITGDAHAGIWHRQVSLLAGESIDTVKKKLPHLKHGVFAENIVTRGLDLMTLAVGDRLVINDQVELEVTQIGKKCHNDGCAIKKATGDCIMPKEGIFTKVIRGGVVKADLPIKIERNADVTKVV